MFQRGGEARTKGVDSRRAPQTLSCEQGRPLLLQKVRGGCVCFFFRLSCNGSLWLIDPQVSLWMQGDCVRIVPRLAREEKATPTAAVSRECSSNRFIFARSVAFFLSCVCVTASS